MIDFYALLGVDKNESSQEIKKAYRKLALKYHPDRHQSDPDDAEEMMKLLNEAKDVLLSDEKREEYDAAFYSFQQFKARQQQEAERRQQQEAKRRQQQEAERRQQQEAERRQQQEAEHRQQQEAEHRQRQEAKRRQQQEAERRQAREDYDRWRQEAKRRQQQEAARKESIIKSFKEQLLREEKAQRLAEAERLAREAEEKHNQEVLARALKKRNRLLLVFIMMVLGIFYMYQKHQSANKYLDDPYAVYDFDENTEVQIPPDLYDEPAEEEVAQDTDKVSASWLEEKVADADQLVSVNDRHDIQVNGSQTDFTQPEPPQRVAPIEPKAEKSEPASAPPKKKEDSLSIDNDDFFN